MYDYIIMKKQFGEESNMNYRQIPFIYNHPVTETILTGVSLLGFPIGIFIVTYLVFVIQSFIAASIWPNEYMALGAFMSLVTSILIGANFAIAGPAITIPFAIYNIVSFIRPDSAMYVAPFMRVLLSVINIVYIIVGIIFASLFFVDIDSTLELASGFWYLRP